MPVRILDLLRTRVAPLHFALVLAVLVPGPGLAGPPGPVAPDLWLQRHADLAAWSADGLTVGPDGARIDPATARPGHDDAGRYHGGDFLLGTLTSPIRYPAGSFDEAVASWNADTPAGTWIEARVRAHVDGRWTKDYVLGVWTATDDGPVRRQSVAGQRDDDGDVATDTLQLRRPAAAYQLSFALFTVDPAVTPTLRLASIVTGRRGERPAAPPSDRSAWGVELPVPERSQMVYPNGGEVWCSPTSTKMVLEYWADLTGDDALRVPVPRAAAATYDAVYRGNGNWPFNTAYAGTFGLEAYVARFSSLVEVERWVNAGVPVIISFGWKAGELRNAPIASASGHLSVIRGFDADGNVIMNDSAGADDAQVRRVYRRAELESVWLRRSGGIVYLIYPPGWPVPDYGLPAARGRLVG